MTSIGYATLDVIPSFKGLRGELERGTGGPLAAAGARGGAQFGDQAGKAAGGRFGSIFSKAAKASLLGVAGGAALAFKIGSDSVEQASDLGESLNAVNLTYGKQARAVKKLGRESAQSLGLSNSAFNGLAVQYSAFAKTIGGDKKTVRTLDDLTTRAADFASVMNLEVSESATLFQSGLAGETEPLRKYGIDLSAAAVESYAFANGIANAGDKLTESQKIQARYASLMEQTSKTQGDFANTSDSLANRQRILSARWDDARAKLGQGLLPIIEDSVGVILNRGIPAFEDFSGWFTSKGLPAIQDFMDEARPLGESVLPAAADAFYMIRDGAEAALPLAKDLVDAFNDMPDWAKKALAGGAIATAATVKFKGSDLFGARGAPTNPAFVTVTNPSGPGGGTTPDDKKPKPGAATRGANALSLLPLIPAVDEMLKGNKFTEGADDLGRATNEFFVDLKDAIPNTDKSAGVAALNNLGSNSINGNDLDSVRTEVLDRKLEGINSKAGRFGETLDLIGGKKVDPSLTIRGMDKARGDLQKFLAQQIEARKPITPYVTLTGYDRALAQIETLTAKIHSIPTAGVDNGVTYGSGGGTSAGIVNNFHGPINATDTKDITRQAQRKSRERGLGGRP